MSKIKITLRALVQRINRLLAKDGSRLVAYRGERLRHEEGLYCVVDANNHVGGPPLYNLKNIEAYGRELGALKAWEVLEEK